MARSPTRAPMQPAARRADSRYAPVTQSISGPLLREVTRSIRVRGATFHRHAFAPDGSTHIRAVYRPLYARRTDVHAHLFEVSCTVDEPDPSGQRFRLPAWVPGSYLIREFARHFVSVRAHCEGQEITVRKLAKDCWQVDPVRRTALLHRACLRLRRLGARRLSRRDPRIFRGRLLVRMAGGTENVACELDIVAPTGQAYADWGVATSMPARAPPLCDSDAIAPPTTTSSSITRSRWARSSRQFRSRRRDARHRGHRAATAATSSGFARDMQRVCQTQIDLFEGAPGSRAPVDYYLFQLLLLADGYGGLEHRSSTSLCGSSRARPGSLGARTSATTIERCSASPATSISTPGTSSASSPSASSPTTSLARPTRASCGRSKASLRTTTI